MRKLFPALTMLLLLTVAPGRATETENDTLQVYDLDEDIVITATKLPVVFADVARSVEVIKAKDIRLMPVQSLPEVLEYAAGVDVQQRGTQGVQADVSIRGAGFEQTLILLDGVKMNDPQTGHHNMNIPVHVNDIARIEILRGPGSRLYGPNAFGGVINIITRKGERPGVRVFSMLGEHNLNDAGLSAYYPWGAGNHRISASRGSSDGYRPNTDFLNTTISHNSTFEFDDITISAASGYSDKQFGANSFYTTRFPEQYEETKVWYVQATGSYISDKWRLQANSAWREHEDVFRLVRSDPAFYQNTHLTQVFSNDAHLSYYSPIGVSTIGLEWSEQGIKSNNLGRHSRSTLGTFLQQQFELDPFQFAAGVSAFKYSTEEWQAWPGLDVNLGLTENLHFFASYAQGFRVPTYTELYYNDPVTAGNAALESEQSENIEGGFSATLGPLQLGGSFFYRNSENLIDFVLDPEDDIYKAQNITAMQTNGLEGNAQLFPNGGFVNRVFARVTRLDSDLDKTGFVSRYTLTHFRTQATVGLDHQLPFWPMLSLHWRARYEDRLNSGDHLLGDARINYDNGNGLNIYIDVTNVGDVSYQDIPGVPMPGRWFKAGFTYAIIARDE